MNNVVYAQALGRPGKLEKLFLRKPLPPTPRSARATLKLFVLGTKDDLATALERARPEYLRAVEPLA
jgi:hypothetical protein